MSCRCRVVALHQRADVERNAHVIEADPMQFVEVEQRQRRKRMRIRPDRRRFWRRRRRRSREIRKNSTSVAPRLNAGVGVIGSGRAGTLNPRRRAPAPRSRKRRDAGAAHQGRTSSAAGCKPATSRRCGRAIGFEQAEIAFDHALPRIFAADGARECWRRRAARAAPRAPCRWPRSSPRRRSARRRRPAPSRRRAALRAAPAGRRPPSACRSWRPRRRRARTFPRSTGTRTDRPRRRDRRCRRAGKAPSMCSRSSTPSVTASSWNASSFGPAPASTRCACGRHASARMSTSWFFCAVSRPTLRRIGCAAGRSKRRRVASRFRVGAGASSPCSIRIIERR